MFTTANDLTEDEQQQAIIFDKTTAKGVEDSLFQASMKSIRFALASANRLRTGLVLAGLFTDKAVYREVIALFYTATNALEAKLVQMKDRDEICAKLLSLGYLFAPQYERDLETLYSKATWEKEVEKVLEKSSQEAKDYIERIARMTSGTELAGVAFCLWGALIIGGGAVAMPRVEALCVKDAIHIFKAVTGPGRGERKTQFVEVWDALAGPEDDGFPQIVASCQECIQDNNELIASVRKNPWWLKYAVSTVVGVAVVGVHLLQQQRNKR